MGADDVRYVFERLDMDHVRGCAALARGPWDGGPWDAGVPFEVCYQPGDGTHYALLFVPIDRRLPILGAPGGGTGDSPPSHGWGGVLKGHPDRMLVYWIQKGRGLEFSYGQYLDPSWIESYLPTTGGSVLALAVLLNLISSNDETWKEKYLERIIQTEGAA